MIDALQLKPKGYSSTTDGNRYYALYHHGGFWFHCPIDENDIADGAEKTVLDETISSENRLRESERMDVDDAVKLLEEYVKNCGIDIRDYYS